MPDEATLRRSEFTEGEPIVLADGQAWTFPRPTVQLFPAFDAEGNFAACHGRPTFGPDYDAKLETFLQAGPVEDQLQSLMALAVDLLRRNYTLTPADLAAILRYRPDDEASSARWQAIADVAQGRSPKASPVGDA